MSDIERRLLLETLMDLYRAIAPEASPFAHGLMRKLASGLYDRGARMSIGTPLKYHTIFSSVDENKNFVWTCKNFNAALEYRPHYAIGRHISEFLTPDSLAYIEDFTWPELLRKGKVEAPVSFLTRTGIVLIGSAKSQVLLDSTGAFLRTFTRISIPILGGLLLLLVG